VLEKDIYGGAWSETWLANRQKTKYVIKSHKHEIFNHPENQDTLKQHIRYFNEEAKALAKCEHEYIVKIIEKLLLPQENNHPCIVMEYIEGVRLDADGIELKPKLVFTFLNRKE
jgi:serine/threonine protein kinase